MKSNLLIILTLIFSGLILGCTDGELKSNSEKEKALIGKWDLKGHSIINDINLSVKGKLDFENDKTYSLLINFKVEAEKNGEEFKD